MHASASNACSVTECHELEVKLASVHTESSASSTLLEQVKRLSSEKVLAEAAAAEVTAKLERAQLEAAAAREQAALAEGMNREIQKLSRDAVSHLSLIDPIRSAFLMMVWLCLTHCMCSCLLRYSLSTACAFMHAVLTRVAYSALAKQCASPHVKPLTSVQLHLFTDVHTDGAQSRRRVRYWQSSSS